MLGAAGHLRALVMGWPGAVPFPGMRALQGGACRHRLQRQGVHSGLLSAPEAGYAAAWPKTSP